MAIEHDSQISMEDITDRAEELETEAAELLELEDCDLDDSTADLLDAAGHAELAAEIRIISELLEDLRGNGGDHQWRGDWYPGYLIADDHFTDYTREMLEDCGTIPADLPGWVAIDWEETARAVRQDYSLITFNGSDYWYR